MVNNLPIDSMGTKCTSGYTLAHGFSGDTNTTDFFPADHPTVPAPRVCGDRPDHQGPRMAYAEPTTAGHIVLDRSEPYPTTMQRLSAIPSRDDRLLGGAIATNGATKTRRRVRPRHRAPDSWGRRWAASPTTGSSASMNANLATGLFHEAMFGVARERPELLTLANNATKVAGDHHSGRLRHLGNPGRADVHAVTAAIERQ